VDRYPNIYLSLISAAVNLDRQLGDGHGNA
jgi:hypothetical protein